MGNGDCNHPTRAGYGWGRGSAEGDGGGVARGGGTCLPTSPPPFRAGLHLGCIWAGMQATERRSPQAARGAAHAARMCDRWLSCMRGDACVVMVCGLSVRLASSGARGGRPPRARDRVPRHRECVSLHFPSAMRVIRDVSEPHGKGGGVGENFAIFYACRVSGARFSPRGASGVPRSTQMRQSGALPSGSHARVG